MKTRFASPSYITSLRDHYRFFLWFSSFTVLSFISATYHCTRNEDIKILFNFYWWYLHIEMRSSFINQLVIDDYLIVSNVYLFFNIRNSSPEVSNIELREA